MRSRLRKTRLFLLALGFMATSFGAVAVSVAPADAAGPYCNNFAGGFARDYKWRPGYGQSAKIYHRYGTYCGRVPQLPYVTSRVNSRSLDHSRRHDSTIIPHFLDRGQADFLVYGGIVSVGRCKTDYENVMGTSTVGVEIAASDRTRERSRVCA